jgi:hypothetical protein
MPYNIQGNQVSLGEEPFLHGNNKHYVPLRDVVEQLGGTVAFDNNTKMATAAIGQWTARITMGDSNVDVSGTPVTLTAEPFVRDGQMYVPFDFFRDAFGYNVSLNGDTLNISLPNQ